MKTSGILLLISVLLIGLKVLKPELTGILLVSHSNAPKNNIVEFWMKSLKYKGDSDTLRQGFRHLRLDGGGAVRLEVLPGEASEVFCLVAPTGRYFKRQNDTLVIDSRGSSKPIRLQVYGMLESIDVIHGTSLEIERIRQTSLYVNVADRSRVELISSMISGNFPEDTQPAVEELLVTASGESRVELRQLKTSSISAEVYNSMLHYSYDLKADTLKVHLRGKSNTRAMNFSKESGVRHLKVSGDTTYFTPYLKGKGVALFME